MSFPNLFALNRAIPPHKFANARDAAFDAVLNVEDPPGWSSSSADPGLVVVFAMTMMMNWKMMTEKKAPVVVLLQNTSKILFFFSFSKKTITNSKP